MCGDDLLDDGFWYDCMHLPDAKFGMLEVVWPCTRYDTKIPWHANFIQIQITNHKDTQQQQQQQHDEVDDVTNGDDQMNDSNSQTFWVSIAIAFSHFLSFSILSCCSPIFWCYFDHTCVFEHLVGEFWNSIAVGGWNMYARYVIFRYQRAPEFNAEWIYQGCVAHPPIFWFRHLYSKLSSSAAPRKTQKSPFGLLVAKDFSPLKTFYWKIQDISISIVPRATLTVTLNVYRPVNHYTTKDQRMPLKSTKWHLQSQWSNT